MVTRALPYEPKGPRIDQEDDEDYSSDDMIGVEKREKPRKKKSSTQALVEFLNTTGPEEFQKQVVPKRGSTLFFRRRKKSPARPAITTTGGNPKKYVEIVTNYPLDILSGGRLSKASSLTAAKYSGFHRSVIAPDGLPGGTPLPPQNRKPLESTLYSASSRTYFSELSSAGVRDSSTTEAAHYLVKSNSDYSVAASDTSSPAIPLKSSRRATPPTTSSRNQQGYTLSGDSGMTFGNLATWADSTLSDGTGVPSSHSRTPSPQEVQKKSVDRSRSMDNLRASNISGGSQENAAVIKRPRSKSGSLASQWPSRSIRSPNMRSDRGGKDRGHQRVDLVERALSQRIEAFRATKGNSNQSKPSDAVADKLATEHIRALQLSSFEQIEAVEISAASAAEMEFSRQSILTNTSNSPTHLSSRANMVLIPERKKVRHVQVQTMDSVEKCRASTQTDSLIVVREGANVAVGPSGENIDGTFVACPSCSFIFHQGPSDNSNPNSLHFDHKKSYSTPTAKATNTTKISETTPQRPASAGDSTPKKKIDTSSNSQEDLQQQVTSLLHAVSQLQTQLSDEQRAKKRLMAAMNDSNDKSEILNALAYKKLRELWEEKCRWESVCFDLQERFMQGEQLEVDHDRMWSRDWNHELYANSTHPEESVINSQDHVLG
ncbi:hypothetical protein VKS41_001471 [Umbelopsis sp. WA50703]